MSSSFINLASDQEALVSMLTRMNMLAAGEVPQVHQLKGGVSSDIVRIDVGPASFCLKQALPTLKVAKEWHAPVERVFEEIAWLRQAAAIVPMHVPKILGVDSETGSFLMEYLPEQEFQNWKEALLRGEVTPGVASELGRILNQIHSQTADNAAIIDVFDKPFNAHNIMAIRLDPYLRETGRQHPARAAYFEMLVQSFLANKLCLVHGDVSPKNILIGPNGPVILDAECACYGDPAFDVAFLLNHLLLKAAFCPQSARAYGDEYSGFVTAYFADISWESKSALETRVAQLLPALLLARVDGKSPVEYLTEDQRSKTRQRALQLLDRQATSLTDIQSFWIDQETK